MRGRQYLPSISNQPSWLIDKLLPYVTFKERQKRRGVLSAWVAMPSKIRKIGMRRESDKNEKDFTKAAWRKRFGSKTCENWILTKNNQRNTDHSSHINRLASKIRTLGCNDNRHKLCYHKKLWACINLHINQCIQWRLHWKNGKIVSFVSGHDRRRIFL